MSEEAKAKLARVRAEIKRHKETAAIATKMLYERLLPCPFCGSGAVFVRASESAEYVMCGICNCCTPMMDIGNRTRIAQVWNRRIAAQPEGER